MRLGPRLPTVGTLMKSVYSKDPGSAVSHHSPYDSLDFHDLATQLAPFSVDCECNTPSRRKKKQDSFNDGDFGG